MPKKTNSDFKNLIKQLIITVLGGFILMNLGLLKEIGKFLSTTIKMPIGLFFLLIILPFIIKYFWEYFIGRRFLHYTTDEFEGILWHWRYSKEDNSYKIVDLKGFCIKCKRELSEDRQEYIFCKNCSKRVREKTEIDLREIEKSIKHKIGEYFNSHRWLK
jgi:hypothetical protein